MKTDNIYIGKLACSKKVDYDGTLYDYFCGSGIRQHVEYQPIKYVIVKKIEDWGNTIAIDLKTKKKYLCELPIEKGVLFVSPSKMFPFEGFYPDAPRNLSKRKILEMGNAVIDAINKIENPKKKK